MKTNIDSLSVRSAAALMLVGQLLYILITQFHAGGDANDHRTIFAVYAGSGDWTVVHLGQFLAMAVFLAGLLSLGSALDIRGCTASWAGRFGVALAAVALALYGALQAVDGVANKQADAAWASAPPADKAARFASAETLRWIEWGLRGYHTYALGLALLLFAIAVIRTASMPSSIGVLMGISGLAYLVQGWVVGAEGFSGFESIAIVLAWVLDVAWMSWLVVVDRRDQNPGTALPADMGDSRPSALPMSYR